MKYAIKIPPVGESITEATISAWLKKDGEYVNVGDPVLSVDTDKASVEVVAESAGTVSTKAKPGDVVKIGAVVGEIDSEGKAQSSKQDAQAPKATPAPASSQPQAANGPNGSNGSHGTAPNFSPSLSPSVRRVVAESGIDPSTLTGTGPKGRITKADALAAASGAGGSTAVSAATITPLRTPEKAPRTESQRGARRVPMTTIRKRIAERLVAAQQTAAILTTFNEVDMTQVMSLREKYKEKFKGKYGISLGFMGFFVKAVIEALREFPQVNAYIDGTDIIYNDFFNIGVAVSTEKGLIVPVIHDADRMTLAEIEIAIRNYSTKAREGKISIEDLSGGTFTVSNGGVFGSLMSTPILNPPQSGILGMHAIQERPVAINGKVEIRPMMYLALSYDHRMIDGREAVSFLVRIKDCINDPNRLLLEI